MMIQSLLLLYKIESYPYLQYSMSQAYQTHRTEMSKCSKFGSSGGFRDMQLNSPEHNKMVVIRKIIMISSMKKEIKRIMQKMVDNGLIGFNEDQSKILMEEAKKILDNDKQKELAKDLSSLTEDKENPAILSTMILKLIKYYVVSPIEKSYIAKIEKELKEDEQLDHEIKDIEAEIDEEKKNKLTIYDLEKKGMVLGMSTKVINRKKEVENYENKLMRSNQKLNQLQANNNKLREKISQLRKEKNAMETIYNRLKVELDKKNENVENTIKFANDANNARYQAEKDLKTLKEQAESKKEQFKEECQKLNNEIQHDIRFKNFIKSKHIEKEQLDKLEEQIRINEKNIEDKKQSNQRIEKEYKKSLAKEQEIKRAFDMIKKQIGIGDVGPENEGKELLSIFNSLYEKNSIMNNFVEELTKEVEDLEEQIVQKRANIQQMYLKGTADQIEKDKINEELKNKVEYQKRKKKILDEQYQKSLDTMAAIKEHLLQIFEEIMVDSEVIEKLKNCNINEENLTEFLGQLQKKGLEAISHYGKLVGEQLKAEKGSSWEIQKQIEELNNVITIENVASMNSATAKSNQYPSELLIKLKDEKLKEEELQKPLTLQEFKKLAIQSLEQLQKKKTLPDKPARPKFGLSHQTATKLKTKLKEIPDFK